MKGFDTITTGKSVIEHLVLWADELSVPHENDLLHRSLRNDVARRLKPVFQFMGNRADLRNATTTTMQTIVTSGGRAADYLKYEPN